MADAHDADDASAVVDLVEDTIVADADAVIGVPAAGDGSSAPTTWVTPQRWKLS